MLNNNNDGVWLHCFTGRFSVLLDFCASFYYITIDIQLEMIDDCQLLDILLSSMVIAFLILLYYERMIMCEIGWPLVASLH